MMLGFGLALVVLPGFGGSGVDDGLFIAGVLQGTGVLTDTVILGV